MTHEIHINAGHTHVAVEWMSIMRFMTRPENVGHKRIRDSNDNLLAIVDEDNVMVFMLMPDGEFICDEALRDALL